MANIPNLEVAAVRKSRRLIILSLSLSLLGLRAPSIIGVERKSVENPGPDASGTRWIPAGMGGEDTVRE